MVLSRTNLVLDKYNPVADPGFSKGRGGGGGGGEQISELVLINANLEASIN